MVNVLAELERCGCSYEWAGEFEIRTKCPFHDDTSPSCTVNIDKRVFICQAAECKQKGDFFTFLAGLLKTTRHAVYTDLAQRYNLETSKVIDASLIERYHASIWDAKPLIAELKKRAVDEDMIRKYRLGEREGRITIPIKNESGLFVNVLRYLPGAPGKDKMRNTRGHSKIRIFPIEQMRYDRIMICGGPIKAIVAAWELNRYGIGAVSFTGGEGNWPDEFTQQFNGKEAFICLDIDDGGRAGTQLYCNKLQRVASAIYDVLLPLDIDEHPHGDINDYAARGGLLKPLVDSAPEWEPRTKVTLVDDEPESMHLSAASHAGCAGKRLKIEAIITAMDTTPFVIPKDFAVECDQSLKECSVCPVMSSRDFSIHPESQPLLEMVNAPRAHQKDAIKRAIGVPSSCEICDFEVKSYFNIEDVRLSPQLEITNRTAERVMQPALCIGDGLELNEGYELVGRMYPHPKSQQSTLLISKYSPTQDALSTYVPDNLDRLMQFRPSSWSLDGIGEQLDTIYQDLEANVTRIFQRRNVHLLVDLAYHSPLLIKFDGKTAKGWVETLVVGDSAQGKSETAINMMQHYGLGEKVECKNATVAGLLGGLQKMGDRWFVTWGVIPTHDKRLVLMEELKGASTDIIAKLTDMRSSGIAEIPKIEKRRTHARTRLVALSNPRRDHPMSSYNFGVEAVKELIGALEDIRRFDAIAIVSSRDMDPSVLNQLQVHRPKIRHLHTSELCRALVLWVWTRTQDQVLFEKDAIAGIMQESTRLCSLFSDSIPIVDRGSIRYKLARLSASLAGRTFSTDETLQKILVRPGHVEYITKYLEDMYSAATFGYLDYTKAVQVTDALIDPEMIEQRLNSTPFPRDFVRQMLHTSDIDSTDIQDWCGWDRQTALDLISFFVRKHALVRDGRQYRKSPPFISLLKDVKITDRPDYIKEEF